MRKNHFTLLFIFLIFNFEFSIAQTSTLISVGVNGKLIYTADSKGNTVPDFSGVGYMNSESEIPFVPVVLVVNAVTGDNLSNVQNAINTVAAMPLNSNGFRGAILFKAGAYNISDTIKISSSGIVLRGEGFGTTGTRFIATKTSQYSLFYFAGNNGISEISSSKKSITDKYVPIGTKNITVAAGHTFQVGDNVLLHRIPKNSWIDLLTMAQWGWTASAYDINYERKINAVAGNVITLDAPVVDIIDTAYATGELTKYTSSRIEKCGIENMRISSTYISDIDENHGWEAVTFYNIINAWAKNLEVYYFGYSAVHVLDGAAWITIDSCKMYDAKSTVDGGRRYSFNVDGQRSLVQNCVTRNGRHDYVNGSRTPGPVVFYNSQSTLQLNDIGPHHRWSTGILFDNIVGDGRMDVQNRTSSGTGHGWAGAQTMFWNCKGNRMVIHDPQGDERNWAVGCIFNEVTNVGDMTTEPLGFVESSGTRIAAIPSLFSMQLNERLTPLRQNQTITFPVISTKYLFSSDFNPNAVASSGLTITYTSSNPSVATIINGLVHITGVGVTTITASQAGNYYYINPANSVSQILTVSGSYNYYPDSAFLLHGSMCNCTLKNDTTANNIYHIVNSTTTSNPKSDWYTSTIINQTASSYNKLIVNLKIKYSKTINQILYLYKWSNNTWTPIDTREVTNSDSYMTLNILNYSNYISPQGQLRMRVFATGGVTNFTCLADWISFSAEY